MSMIPQPLSDHKIKEGMRLALPPIMSKHDRDTRSKSNSAKASTLLLSGASHDFQAILSPEFVTRLLFNR